jgi:hypothetical protein
VTFRGYLTSTVAHRALWVAAPGMAKPLGEKAERLFFGTFRIFRQIDRIVRKEQP